MDNYWDYEKVLSYIFNQYVEVRDENSSNWFMVHDSEERLIYTEEIKEVIEDDSFEIMWEIIL